MFTVIVTSAVPILIVVIYWIKFARRDKLFSKIPSPKKNFLLHNAAEFLGVSVEEIFKKIEKWHKELGDVYHVTLHPLDCGMIVVADHNIAEALSLQQPDRHRSRFYEAISRWIGADGYFLSPEKELKNQIKPILMATNPKLNERYLRMINSQSNELEKILKISIGRSIDVFELARRGALDITFETLMEYDLNTKNGCNMNYVEAVIKSLECQTKAMFHPISRDAFLHQFTSLGREEARHVKVLQDFSRARVRERRQELADGKESRDWLILNHYIKNKVDGRFYTDEEIRVEIDTMIFGVHDTSKTAIAFALYLLAKHPEIQTRVYNELKIFLQPGVDVTEDDLLHFPYLEAVLKESLRLYTPVPYVARKITSEITTGGFTFPKDAEIIISPFLMARNPKYFKDPLNFDPDRFIGITSPPPGYNPFSIGARKCTGSKVIIRILKVLLARLIMKFKFSLAPGHEEVEVITEIILKPEDGIILRLESR